MSRKPKLKSFRRWAEQKTGRLLESVIMLFLEVLPSPCGWMVILLRGLTLVLGSSSISSSSSGSSSSSSSGGCSGSSGSGA